MGRSEWRDCATTDDGDGGRKAATTRIRVCRLCSLLHRLAPRRALSAPILPSPSILLLCAQLLLSPSMSSSSNAQALQVALSHLAGALTYTEPTNIGANKENQNRKKEKQRG